MACLHPAKNYRSESRNDASIVLSLAYKDFRMLFTGDLEERGEKLLTEQYAAVTGGYDVIKAAHHGSGYSTGEAFLTWSRPLAAVISCGKNNRYGHPHPDMLERLDRHGTKAYITKEGGAVTVSTDGKSFKIDEFLLE